MFMSSSTQRLSTVCLAVHNPAMHETVSRLLDYAQEKTKDTPSEVTDFRDLQDRLSISSATLSNWKQRGVSKEGAINAERQFGCSTNWILNGTGPRDALPPGTFAVHEVETDSHPELEPVRVVRLRLKAGQSGFAVEPDYTEAPPIFFRSDWLRRRGFKPYKLVATRVGGQSMEPTLFQDDVVVANTADTEPKDGEVFAVNYEGESVVKRLVRDGGEWWLCSDNPDKTRFPNKQWIDGSAIIVGRIVHRQSERI